jgi:hypothetical protein
LAKAEVCFDNRFGWVSLIESPGIYGPGYEERRRERLAEKYGIDFTNVERR